MDMNLIIKMLVEKVSAHLIILFGSVAKGWETAESDLDIAFLSDKENNEYDVFMLSQELADSVKREVDLVDLGKASTVLRAQIVGTGNIIYSADKNKTDEFRIRALKEYCLLNEERRPVLDRIKERGSVYA